MYETIFPPIQTTRYVESSGSFGVCSRYKFFGPHQGVLYGRYELLD
jgi:hypothetical protein